MIIQNSKFKKLQVYVASGVGIKGLIAVLAMRNEMLISALLLSIITGAVAAL